MVRGRKKVMRVINFIVNLHQKAWTVKDSSWHIALAAIFVLTLGGSIGSEMLLGNH